MICCEKNTSQEGPIKSSPRSCPHLQGAKHLPLFPASIRRMTQAVPICALAARIWGLPVSIHILPEHSIKEPPRKNTVLLFLKQDHICFTACAAHLLRPDRSLHLTDMNSSQEQHAEP